jgi:hypothetical protein
MEFLRFKGERDGAALSLAGVDGPALVGAEPATVDKTVEIRWSAGGWFDFALHTISGVGLPL